MANNINDLDISKFFGVDVSTNTIKQTKIHIPKEAWDEINNKMETYRKVIKENRHSGVRDKVKSTLKTGDLSDKEKDRRKNLTDIFKETKKWINGAKLYFWRCQDNKKIQEMEKEIYQDFKELTYKGYLNNNKYSEYESFVTNNYSLPTKYANEPYSTQIVHIYEHLYKAFYAALDDKDNEFKKLLEEAKNSKTDYTENIEDISNETNEKFKTYKEKYSNIKKIIDEKYSKDTDEEFVRKKTELIDTYNSCRQRMSNCLQNIKSINARATFLHEFELEHYERNVSKSLQQCSNGMNKFSNIVTNNTYNFKNLNETYAKILANLKASNNYLKEFLSPHSKSQKSQNKITKIIRELDELIATKKSEFDAQIEKFNASLTELDTKYGEWQKQQNEKKKRTALLAVFMAFGAVSAAISGLFPIIDALIFPTKPEFGSYSG